MNREIKFRAWVDNRVIKEMIYPKDVQINSAIGYALQFLVGYEDAYPDKNNIEQWQKDIVFMQFTGLLDKNGKEIYADDLLKDEHGVIFRIYHVAGGYIMKENYWKANCKELNATDELIYCPLADSQNKSLVKYSCEIIGNIYENPNLIN